jgi:hypothetical protein
MAEEMSNTQSKDAQIIEALQRQLAITMQDKNYAWANTHILEGERQKLERELRDRICICDDDKQKAFVKLQNQNAALKKLLGHVKGTLNVTLHNGHRKIADDIDKALAAGEKTP